LGRCYRCIIIIAAAATTTAGTFLLSLVTVGAGFVFTENLMKGKVVIFMVAIIIIAIQ